MNPVAPHNIGLNLPSEVWKAMPIFPAIKGSLEGYCKQRYERHLRHLAEIKKSVLSYPGPIKI